MRGVIQQSPIQCRFFLNESQNIASSNFYITAHGYFFDNLIQAVGNITNTFFLQSFNSHIKTMYNIKQFVSAGELQAKVS